MLTVARFVLICFLPVPCFAVGSSPCNMEKRCECTTRKDFKMRVDCQEAKLNTTESCSLCVKIKNITVLDLSRVKLGVLPDYCFMSCYELVELHLETNRLSSLSKDSFAGLTKLRLLNINDNSLVHDGNFSGSEAFKPLQSLEELHLQKNTKVTHNRSTTLYYLSNIANDSFPRLKKLYLDGIQNAFFRSNFKYFERLEYIDFSRNSPDCNLFKLTNSSYENLPAIKGLNLSYCHISYIEAATFSPLRELTHLNLSYNMALGFVTLRNVSYGLQFTKIEVLDYSKVYKTFGLSTELRRCDLWYLRNTSLKEIRINSNRIALVETNALSLLPPSLKVVWAEDNLLSYGPFALQMGCLENLERLELNKQQIVHHMALYNRELQYQEKEVKLNEKCEVPRNASKKNCPVLKHKRLNILALTFPPTLKVLGFRQANLRYQTSILKFPLPIKNKIVRMDLSNNLLYNWSGALISLLHLKHVDLSNNFCTDISNEVFLNAPNLQSLDASNNKIGHKLASDGQGNIFEHMKKMRKLNLSNNWIESLPEDIFNHLKTLEVIDLSFNRIPNVTFIPNSMTYLTKLYLQQNKISTLSLKLLKQLERNADKRGKNVTIDLSGNEISISCSNIAFLNWMVQHESNFKNIHAYRFRREDGSTFCYHELNSFLETLKKGCHNYTYLTVLSVALITTFIGIIIGGLCYRFRWRLKYFYYMTRARYLGYLPVRSDKQERVYPYDAFISYSSEDYLFVIDEMVHRLEEESGMSLCIHQRDFIPGHYIAENILQSIKDSKMTIVLLSPNFLESKWCMYEFNMARMEAIYSRDGENVVFVIMYKDIDMSQISHEMRQCLETESFLKFPNDEAEMPYFWHMLIEALGGTKL